MKLAFLFTLASAVTLSMAAPYTKEKNTKDIFHIISPAKSVTYQMGRTGQVSWENGVAGTLTINVVDCADPKNVKPTQWTATYPSSTGPGSYTLPITPALNSKQTYCFELVHKKNKYYSHSFKIDDGVATFH
ncbi:unnamed protein product [Rhizopus stolonifer]